MSHEYSAIRYERHDGIGHITFCRPEKHNSLDLAQGRDMEAVTAHVAADPEVRCVLIDAEGSTFHVGGDLKYFAEAEDMSAAIRSLTTLIHSAVERLSRGPAPVIVAINGVVAGGGLSMAMGADLVYAAESAVFTMAYTAAGLTPDASSSWYLPRLVGLRRAQELIFTNRRLSAHEAWEWGLVTEVVPDEALSDRVMEVATQVASGPTQAFAGVKRLLRASMQQGLESQMADESEMIARMAATEDAQGGIRAFLAKETPTFSGR